MKHFRVDKLRDLELTEESRSPESAEDKTDPAAFSRKTFGMYGGKDIQVRLTCRNYLAGVVIDRFGSDVWMMPQDDEHFSAIVVVTVSPQFFGWVTAIGKDMQITGPEEIKTGYREYLRELLDIYADER